jgi:hypothetical protein
MPGDDTKGRKPNKSRKPKLAIVSTGEVVPLIRGQGKGAEGLTAKQTAFADKVAEGVTLAEAYRHAYEAENMAASTIHAEASRLMADHRIAARVNSQIAARQARTSHDAARMRLHIIERLWAESQDADSPAAARLKALELMGKLDIVGAFRERVSNEADATPSADLAQALQERITALLGKAS